MLSFFPELLFLSPFAALLIRLSLAVVFAYSAWQRIPQNNTVLRGFGIIDGAIALLFFVGAWTQFAALIGIICTILWLVKSEWNPYPRSTTALALIMCLSILVLGAGPLAFDLPL